MFIHYLGVFNDESTSKLATKGDVYDVQFIQVFL